MRLLILLPSEIFITGVISAKSVGPHSSYIKPLTTNCQWFFIYAGIHTPQSDVIYLSAHQPEAKQVRC